MISETPSQRASQPSLTLAELAERLPGSVLHGEPSIPVADIVHPRMLGGNAEVMAVILEEKALALLDHAPVRPLSALVAQDVTVPDGLLKGYLLVERPRLALATLLSIFDRPPHACSGIHPTAVIEASARVEPNVSVGAFVYVGEKASIASGTVLMPHVTIGAEAQIGRDCLLHSGVRIGERIILGNRVILQPNACIGPDGFSYVTPEPGSVETARTDGKVSGQNMGILKIPSLGGVVLEDDVEVGACATIDRSNLGVTLIRKGTKVDNLVMIGHNNTIGENCMIVSQVGVSGSCEIGDRVVIAGQAGLADHLKVGNDAIIMAKSGVMRDIEPREIVVGIPALPRRETLQNVMYTGKLREMFQELRALKKRVAELESAGSQKSESALVAPAEAEV